MEISGAVSLGPETKDLRTGEGRDRVAGWLLLAALLLGLTRFLFLGRWSLWLDEAFTLADSRHGSGHQNPLGYFLFGWFYDYARGRPDETWLRLPAAVFGWLTIPACWWAFRPLFGARVAALAALVVASSGWHLYWSQNARFYTLAQLLVLLGGGGLLRGLAAPSTALTGTGIALLFLAPLAHPSAALLAGPLVFIPWIARWLGLLPEHPELARPWKWLSVAGFLGALAGTGWVLQVWGIWERRRGEGDPLHFLLTCGYFFTPTVGLAFLWGLTRARRERAGFTAVLATVFALSAAGLASFFVRASAQYVFVVLPWLAVIAALPLGDRLEPTEPRTRRRSLALLAVVLLPGLADSALYLGLRNGDRPRWREAYRYVFEQRRPGDLVLGMEAPVAEYYLDPRSDDLRRWKQVTWLDDFRARLSVDWARYARRTWLVVNLEQLKDWRAENRADLLRVLGEECTRQASFVIPFTPRDLNVFVYLRE